MSMSLKEVLKNAEKDSADRKSMSFYLSEKLVADVKKTFPDHSLSRLIEELLTMALKKQKEEAS